MKPVIGPDKPAATAPTGPGRKPHSWEWPLRALIALVLIGSLALTWWSFSLHLIPMQKRTRELTSTVSRLSAQVGDLDRKWTKAQTEQIRKRYQAVHACLFADELALQTWLANLQREAASLALDVKLDFGKSSALAISNPELAVIQSGLTLDIHPLPTGLESSYQRLLEFGQHLAVEGKRADLAELTVEGGTNSITRAILAFNLWVGEENSPSTAAEEKGLAR